MKKITGINILTKDGEATVSSVELARGFGYERTQYFNELIEKHREDLEEFSALRFETVVRKTNKLVSGGIGETRLKTYFLTEYQALLIGTYTKTTAKSKEFRKILIQTFMSMRQTLLSSDKKQIERLVGIQARNKETEMIQKFVEYAKKQGSTHAEMYYTNISKMENKALFLVAEKYPNIRSKLNFKQLTYVKGADVIVEQALQEGMEEGLDYREIYKSARERIEIYSKLVPITPVPLELTS